MYAASISIIIFKHVCDHCFQKTIKIEFICDSLALIFFFYFWNKKEKNLTVKRSC